MGPEKCTGHNGREMFNSARHKSQIEEATRTALLLPPQIFKLPNTENKKILKAAQVGEQTCHLQWHEAKSPGDFSSRE